MILPVGVFDTLTERSETDACVQGIGNLVLTGSRDKRGPGKCVTSGIGSYLVDLSEHGEFSMGCSSCIWVLGGPWLRSGCLSLKLRVMVLDSCGNCRSGRFESMARSLCA